MGFRWEFLVGPGVLLLEVRLEPSWGPEVALEGREGCDKFAGFLLAVRSRLLDLEISGCQHGISGFPKLGPCRVGAP